MKFNLKNRPKIEKWEKQSQDYPEVINTSIKIPSTDDYEKWFGGFEKQLQEFLDAEKLNHETAIAMATDSLDRNDLLSHSWGRIQLLKQILGDKLKTETKP